MKLPNIKDLVKDNTVRFAFYRDGELWYEVHYVEVETGFMPEIKIHRDKVFQFPIPPEDMKGAIFKREDKAILFMRFIRKHLDYLQESLNDAASNPSGSESTKGNTST